MEILENLGIDWKILLAQTINFLVILYLLKRFAYRPFLKILRERKEKIDKGIKRSEEIEKRIQAIKSQKEKILENARQNAFQILKQIEEKGRGKAEQIIKESQKEKEKILEMARKQGEMEIEKMQEIQRKGIINISLGLTEKILKMKIDAEKDKQIIEEFLLNLRPVRDNASNRVHQNNES